jgi:octaprenyl-diphosphate synthase
VELSDVYTLGQAGLGRVETEFKALIQSQHDFPDLKKMLAQILVGGKVVRPTLTLLAGSFYDYDANIRQLESMATSCELMHIATLVHDDAIDSADVRRGRPTINSVWGVDLAVLLGDFLFARAGELATATGSLRVVTLFTQTLGIIARGEIKQAMSSFKLGQTHEQYFERVAAKTAALFTMATESGALLSGAPEGAVQALHRYGFNLGVAFQVVDDILDFVGTEAEVGKPVGADLAQGTLTLPSLLLLERYPRDNPIAKMCRQEETEANIRRAIEMVRGSDIIDECYRVAAGYAHRAVDEISGLPAKPARAALAYLADYILQRKQ